MRWRVRTLAGETARNLLVTPLRSLLLIGLFASLIGALAIAELSFSDDLIAFTRDYERKGGYVAVVTTQGAKPPAAPCERLNDHPSVVAAGGIVASGRTALTTAPGTSISTYEITAGLIGVWDPALRGSNVEASGSAVGSDLAEELGLAAGTLIHPTDLAVDEPFAVGAVADTEARNSTVTRSLFTVSAPTGTVDQCWAEYTPGAFEAALDHLETVFDDGSVALERPITVSPWIKLDEFARNPVAELQQRPQRYGWLLVAGFAALIAWLTIWFRRSELGLYRALGTSRLALLLLVQIEVLAVVLLALPIGMAWAVLVYMAGDASPTLGQLGLAARSAAIAAAAAAALAPLAALLVGRKALLSLLKDR